MSEAKRKRRESMMGPQGTVQSNSGMPGAPQGMLPARPQPMMDQSPNNQDLNPINFMEQPQGAQKIDGSPVQYMFGENATPDVSPRAGYISGNVPNSGMRADRFGMRGLNSQAEGMMPTPSEMYPQLEQDYFVQSAQEKLMRNSPDGILPTEISGMGIVGSPATSQTLDTQEPPARMEEISFNAGMQSTDFSSPDPLALAPGQNNITIGRNPRSKKSKTA